MALWLYTRAATYGGMTVFDSRGEVHYDSNVEIVGDASGRPWTIPPDIVATSDRPGLAIVNRKTKIVIIFE